MNTTQCIVLENFIQHIISFFRLTNVLLYNLDNVNFYNNKPYKKLNEVGPLGRPYIYFQ
jgi:hypothetical protein